MDNNLYAAPNSDVSEITSETQTTPVYSPTQVACGAFIGGPLGLVYFLKSNFDYLNKPDATLKVIFAGLALIIALILIVPILPEDFPSLPITIAYVVAARYISENYQLTKLDIRESDSFDFHSNWRVFGIGLLCGFFSAIAILVPLLMLTIAGVI